MQNISRTVFKKEIICEFLSPVRQSEKPKVVILCSGMPAVPKKDELLYLLAKKGFWVFYPRYRGSWESKGKFLKKSPHLDILDVIDELPRGFKDSRTGKTIKLKPDKLFLIGSSFGGPAAILASKDKRVKKAICMSPVIDWQRQEGTEEPLGWLGEFVKEYFGRAYEFDLKDWKKLKKGNFYNPIAQAGELDGKKIFIIHAKDDKVVSYKPAVRFAKLAGCQLKLLSKGGHLGTKTFLKNKTILQEILNFFRQQ